MWYGQEWQAPSEKMANSLMHVTDGLRDVFIFLNFNYH